MTALVVIGAVIVVALALVWLRSVAARSERRSVERYETALGVLGDVARRSDAAAPVRHQSADSIARAHVDAQEGIVPRPPANEVPPPRIRLEPPTVPLQREGHLPVFGDPDLVGEQPEQKVRSASAAALSRLVTRARDHRPRGKAAETVPSPAIEDALDTGVLYDAAEQVRADDTIVQQAIDVTGDESDPTELIEVGVLEGEEEPEVAPPPRRIDRPRHPSLPADRIRARRRAVALAIVVLAAAISVTSIELAGSHAPSNTGATKPGSTSGHAGSHTATTTTTLPTTLSPTSATASLVTYAVPVRSYTVHFATTGTCWIGVQHHQNGIYLWMSTLGAGESANYSATGALVVRLGAPTVVSISVNGITVDLPSGLKQPYDVAFEVAT